MRSPALLFALPCVLALACSKPGEPAGAQPAASASAAPMSPADRAALEKAKAAAGKLGAATKGRLVEALGQGGPEKAVEVCSVEAQGIARKVQDESGARVGRSSQRLRNPGNAAPPWVAEWLKAQGERKAEGVQGIQTVVDRPGQRVARFLKPIEIEAPCLLCHGDPQAIQPEVKATLAAKYAADKATGYALGDLRGALWAEVDVGR